MFGAPVRLRVTSTTAWDKQLKKALPIAIWLAWTFADVALYVVDCNQQMQLKQWVPGNLKLPIKLGKL